MPMTPITKDPRFATWPGVVLFGAAVLLMWLPALHTPYWGDDYVFLSAAHATNISGAPWWSDFWPATPLRFWRPLSQEAYWRLVDAGLDGNAYATQVVSLCLHVLASIGVAVLALVMARAFKWSRPLATAALGGVVYAGLAMHMLPVHWAAAANNSLLTLFTTLCLAAWIYSAQASGVRRAVALATVPLLLALALLSKESAVLMLPLMLLVRWFAGQRQTGRADVITLLVCAVITAIWVVLHARFTAGTDAAYQLMLGRNVVRNVVAFAAWMSNIPREAVRMATSGPWPKALAWMAVTALPMLVACAMALWHGRSRLSSRQWLCVVLFAGIAYGPYFLLSWNSYAYYAAIAPILPVIALACCCIDHPRLLVILALVALSSWAAVEGTRLLDHPGLIGRARWAESMLQDLQHRQVHKPLWVAVHDSHRFYAVGASGLAWRLHLAVGDIHVVAQCPASAHERLRIDDDGSWHLQTGEKN